VTDQQVVLVLGQEVRYHLFNFWIGVPSGDILWVSIQGEKVVKSPMGSYPGFPHADGRNIEFNREGSRVKLHDFLYGLTITGAGKGPGLVRTYVRGLDGAV
jgi:hypothetical protein